MKAMSLKRPIELVLAVPADRRNQRAEASADEEDGGGDKWVGHRRCLSLMEGRERAAGVEGMRIWGLTRNTSVSRVREFKTYWMLASC